MDPRDDLPAPVFRKGVLKLEDLKTEMQLRSQIVNVVDFGVFVDIGIGETCLVHISRLSNRFVRDPNWHYSVGDVLNVWIQAIDKEKRRITLTAIRPDSAKTTDHRKPGRRPRTTKAGDRQSRHGSRHDAKKHSKRIGKRPGKPKPAPPITDAMVQGKEPMRSFSDLLQYHEKKSTDDDKSS